MAETKRIEILVEEKKTAEGKKFNTYKTFTKNGRKIDVKFRKEVKNLPTENCYANIKTDNMNVDKSKRFPVLWVSEVESYDDITEVRKETNKKQIDELFD